MAPTENHMQEESPSGTRAAAAETPAAPAPKRNYERDEGNRRQKLENQEWAVNVQPKSVDCRACGLEVKLDHRREYCATNWNAHKATCREIEKLMGVPIPKVRQLSQTWYKTLLTVGYSIQIRRNRAKQAPKGGVATRAAPAGAVAVDENGRGALSTDKDGPCSVASKQGASVTDIITPNVQIDGQQESTYDTQSRAHLITGKPIRSMTGATVIALSRYMQEPHNWHRELEVELMDGDDDDDEYMRPLPPLRDDNDECMRALPPLREVLWGSFHAAPKAMETLEASGRNERENSSGRNRDVSTKGYVFCEPKRTNLACDKGTCFRNGTALANTGRGHGSRLGTDQRKAMSIEGEGGEGNGISWNIPQESSDKKCKVIWNVSNLTGPATSGSLFDNYTP
ncbi:hypothetical protein H0H92_008581, partial [Tricholoma furcatifolium]